MSWSDPTRRAVLLVPLALAGCGLRPAFAPGSGPAALRNATILTTPRTEAGATLRDQLGARLGPPVRADYTLTVELDVTEDTAAISPDQQITRRRLTGRARYVLSTEPLGETVATGEVVSFTSFSATDTPTATLAAERDAERRLSVILADQIVSRLALISA